MMLFADRRDAGRQLAQYLAAYRGRDDLLVLALPRGGVPVAYEVARALEAPLDVFMVRKLGVPGHEELAMGAIASGDVLVLNEDVIQALRIPDAVIEAVASRERQELTRREQAYRDHRPPPDPHQHCVILIDDGLATGASMSSAVESVKRQGPSRVVVAVPVAAVRTAEWLAQAVDDLVVARMPEQFFGVGQWYDDFRQTSDEEVRQLLEQADRERSAAFRRT
jgi:predicted phosphoribosyltransferase